MTMYGDKRHSKFSKINSLMKPISPSSWRQGHETREEPQNLMRKVSIPPKLSFTMPTDMEGHSRRKSVDTTEKVCKQNTGLSNDRCVFCDDLLSIALCGEMNLQLSCSHMCHKYCYLIMMDKEDLQSFPFCSQCGEETKCVDAAVQTSLRHQKLLESQMQSASSKSNFFEEPLESVCLDSYEKIVVKPEDVVVGSPISMPTGNRYNEELYKELLKPQVSVTLDTVNCIGEGEYDLNCLVCVKPSKICERPSNTADENTSRLKIIQDIKIKLALNVNNWGDSLLPLNELGELWIFDYLEVSSNGVDWDRVCVNFFEEAILLLEPNGTHLVCQIVIHQDICSINRIDNGLSLNLSNETLPEMQMRNPNPLVISKWEYYLIQAVKNIGVNQIPLLHLTSNAWDIVGETDRPAESLKYCELNEKQLDIPSNLLAKIMPPPEKIPLTVTIAITLINNTSLGNEEYQANVISLLNNVKAKLRPIDKLGLIFVGVDGYGNQSRNGSYVGCVESSWDGWEGIIDGIRVFSNRDINLNPIFNNGFEEMLVGFEKYRHLMPYIPLGINNNNRFIIINSNNYQDQESLENMKYSFRQSFDSSFDKVNLTIDIVRIGKEYSTEVQSIYELLLSPKQNNETLNVTYGSKLLRFDSFLEFTQSLDFIMQCKLQSGYMTYVTIEFMKVVGTEDIISFSEIESIGEMKPICSNLNNLKIIVKNSFPSTERNIMMKLKLRLPNSRNTTKGIMEYPVFNFQTRWSDMSDNVKTLKTRITNKNSENPYILFTDSNSEIVCSPLDQRGQDSYFMDIPLLPPLSSSKDQCFARRITEIAIIKSLRRTTKTTSGEAKNILSNLVSLVFGIVRGFEGQPKKEYSSTEPIFSSTAWESFMVHLGAIDNNQKYIQCLIDALELIQHSLEVDYIYGLVKCQDLINWIT